jgi:predicted ArsR family transcriptional regulator
VARPKSRETKRAQLIKLLKAVKGVDVAAISQKLGWQHHSTRAALTGLRKAGFTIERVENGGGRVASYRITAEPTAAPTK